MSKMAVGNKLLKQIRKCPEVKTLEQKKSGYMIKLISEEQYLVHLSNRAYHPLRRWLKQYTSLKNLKG